MEAHSEGIEAAVRLLAPRLLDEDLRQFGLIERTRATVPLLKPGERAMADANQGWRVDDALRVARATRDLDYLLEQPCQSYEGCQQLRARIDLPMKLDECITDMRMAHRVVADRRAEVVCLKISKQGGSIEARKIHDDQIENRIPRGGRG